MRKYRRVTFQDRCQMSAYLSAGLSRSQIALKLGFSKSTISRELKRNQYASRYVPVKAHRLAQERYRCCRRPYVIRDHVEQIIKKLLQEDWSPVQISGRLRRERVASVSHQGIYDHISRNKQTLAPMLRKCGRRGGGRYAQRSARVERYLSIKTRPVIVEKRSRRGDWERDGMYVANREQLLVLNERKSRYVRICRMGKGVPKEVTALTRGILSQIPIKSYTITNDNGPEFRDSPNQGINVYHCIPGKPQQRGTVENTIGLLRQYISRQQNPDELTDEFLQSVENRINHRPRKCLDFRTPYEVLFKTSVALAL